ncbi:Probable L-type lectin-domain containing receptor kinase VII.2 [Linum perenne]
MGLFNLTNDGNPRNRVFVVEFDVLMNQEFNDLDDNHVGIDVDSLTSVFQREAGELRLNSGENYQVWIDYAGSRINVSMAKAVKKKYKSEKAKIDVGPSSWPFYHRIEQLIGLNPSSSRKPAASKPPPLSGSVRVATGIPVGKRSSSNRNLQNRMNNERQKLKTPYRKRGAVTMMDISSESEEEEEEEKEEEEEEEEEEAIPPFRHYDYSYPIENKKRRVDVGRQQNGGVAAGKEKEGRWGDSIRMLSEMGSELESESERGGK